MIGQKKEDLKKDAYSINFELYLQKYYITLKWLLANVRNYKIFVSLPYLVIWLIDKLIQI
jgi:hypothetical protein